MIGKIKLYALVRKDNPAEMLTITTSVKDCYKYLRTMLASKYFDHYRKWCEVRELDYKKDSSVNKYYVDMELYEEEDQFGVLPFTYNLETLAAEFRQIFECQPLGCDFEFPEEVADWLDKHPDSELK